MAPPTLTPADIRDDLVDRLQAAATIAGDAVFDSRRIAEDSDDLPIASVFSKGGTTRPWAGSHYKREDRLGITICVGGADDAELAGNIDQAEAEVIAALATDSEWLDAFESVSEFTATRSHDIGSARRVGAVAVQFSVTYTVEYAPDLTGHEVCEVAVTTDATQPDGATVSERVFALEE